MSKSISKRFVILAASAILLQPAARAGHVTATADILFSGSSTLHDFEGKASLQPFVASFTEDQETGGLQVTAQASLNIEDMTTENNKRDKNMFKMFDLEHFQLITGELPETAIRSEGSTQTRLHLRIRNVEHDVDATISNLQRNGNQISCSMTFPVSLKLFDLKGPSVMGLIRVDDLIDVECRITGQIEETVTGR